jgi:DNA-binding NtrC family response regulator
MSFRALIFEDDRALRQILWMMFDSRGYEVFSFPSPVSCPLSEEKICPCPEEQSCSDLIISDIQMPFMNGLDFIATQIEKGCRCSHIALMSGNFTAAYVAKAKSLGLTTFAKPFTFTDIKKWLDQIEKDIDPNRKLADWYLNRIQNTQDIS